MSNYKWVKESERYVDLRTEDFRSTSFLSLSSAMLNPLLIDRLLENGINCVPEGDSYELYAINSRIVTITAPLYGMNFDTYKFELLKESYTDTAIDPTQYKWVRETYTRCAKEVASEQAKIFEEAINYPDASIGVFWFAYAHSNIVICDLYNFVYLFP